LKFLAEFSLSFLSFSFRCRTLSNDIFGSFSGLETMEENELLRAENIKGRKITQYNFAEFITV
jgi:hypothetical protein